MANMKTKAQRPAPGPRVRRILLPIDFSERSRRAVAYAVGLAQQFSARLILLHVLEPVVYPVDLGSSPGLAETFAVDYKAAAKTKLLEWQQREIPPELPSEIRLASGQPFHEINRVAAIGHVDLIVLATHGYTGLTHVLLGSTAERVVRHATCPVLTLPERKQGRRRR